MKQGTNLSWLPQKWASSTTQAKPITNHTQCPTSNLYIYNATLSHSLAGHYAQGFQNTIYQYIVVKICCLFPHYTHTHSHTLCLRPGGAINLISTLQNKKLTKWQTKNCPQGGQESTPVAEVDMVWLYMCVCVSVCLHTYLCACHFWILNMYAGDWAVSLQMG